MVKVGLEKTNGKRSKGYIVITNDGSWGKKRWWSLSKRLEKGLRTN